jgi:hypothetical protein
MKCFNKVFIIFIHFQIVNLEMYEVGVECEASLEVLT